MSVWDNKLGIYLIAEIGGNHEGDFKKALDLTQLACSSGVDAVKFQIYTGDSLVNAVEDPQRNSHFKTFELTPEQHISLAEECARMGTTYVASVWDMDAFEWIDPFIQFYKVGSGDLTAYPFLERITATGKPIVISTGLATLKEVRSAIEYLVSLDLKYGGKENLALLQCTSMYPNLDIEANLNVMKTFNTEFEATLGYSDHTEGTMAVETVVAMGAEIIEFHFTDRIEGQEFRDHKVSWTTEDIATLRSKIIQIKTLMGSSYKMPTSSEIEADHVNSFRRSVYPVRDLEAGHIITREDLVVLRPCKGIDAQDFDKLLGRKTKRVLSALKPISWEDLR